jgi:hypothetical protein
MKKKSLRIHPKTKVKLYSTKPIMQDERIVQAKRQAEERNLIIDNSKRSQIISDWFENLQRRKTFNNSIERTQPIDYNQITQVTTQNQQRTDAEIRQTLETKLLSITGNRNVVNDIIQNLDDDERMILNDYFESFKSVYLSRKRASIEFNSLLAEIKAFVRPFVQALNGINNGNVINNFNNNNNYRMFNQFFPGGGRRRNAGGGGLFGAGDGGGDGGGGGGDGGSGNDEVDDLFNDDDNVIHPHGVGGGYAVMAPDPGVPRMVDHPRFNDYLLNMHNRIERPFNPVLHPPHQLVVGNHHMVPYGPQRPPPHDDANDFIVPLAPPYGGNADVAAPEVPDDAAAAPPPEQHIELPPLGPNFLPKLNSQFRRLPLEHKRAIVIALNAAYRIEKKLSDHNSKMRDALTILRSMKNDNRIDIKNTVRSPSFFNTLDAQEIELFYNQLILNTPEAVENFLRNPANSQRLIDYLNASENNQVQFQAGNPNGPGGGGPRGGDGSGGSGGRGGRGSRDDKGGRGRGRGGNGGNNDNGGRGNLGDNNGNAKEVSRGRWAGSPKDKPAKDTRRNYPTRSSVSATRSGTTFGIARNLFGNREDDDVIIGRGAEPSDNTDDTSKYFVDTKMLNNNKLCIKYKSTTNYRMKPIDISTDVQLVIKDILDDKFSERHYNSLTQPEKKIIAVFVDKMKLNHIKLPDDEIAKLYNEWIILRGEYISGNDNPEVKQKLRKLTLQLLDLGKISRSNGYNLLYELSL